jgi:hypothetical protein
MSAINSPIVALGLLAIVVAGCGAPPSPGAGGAATPTPVATVAASAATPSASPTIRPSPVVSLKGAISVKEPALGDQITSPVTISGEASVFEATLVYRVVTTGGRVLAEGTTTATAGAPQKGTFRVEVTFEAPYYGEAGSVEVFERSPKDGTISDIARVPVGIVGSY